MKKLLALVLIVIMIIALAACSKSAPETSTEATTASTTAQKAEESTSGSAAQAFDKQEAVRNLHFGYESGANIKETTNGKMVENENYNTIVSFQENKSMEELAQSRGLSFTASVKINGTEWNQYGYKDEQVSTVLYMTEKEGGTYVVSFSHDVNLDINIDAEINAFMNAVTFE